MLKKELIRRLANENDTTLAEANKMLTSVIEVVSEALEEGEKVSLTNLGILYTKEVGERMGRNVITGEPKVVPPKKHLYFKSSKAIKRRINGEE